MIEFQSVTKQFPDGTLAVEDFSFVMPSHQTTVFVGSSGCGKTTLLRMINRMIEPTSGQIPIDGEDIRAQDKVKLRRSIGYVLQTSGLLPHRTVVDNVATVPVLNGVPRRRHASAALELLDKVGLDRSLAKRYPRQLSGGQQQRVGVARAPGRRPQHPAHGRAVRRGRPHRARRPAGRAQPAAARAGQDHRVRHPRHRRGVPARRPGRHPREGRRIAQAGTPAEILAHPADDFVASFVGADRGKRVAAGAARRPTAPRSWSTRTDARSASWPRRCTAVNWTRTNLDLICS